MVRWRPAIRLHPAIRREDFWGDLANTMLLRPAYRMSSAEYVDSGVRVSELKTQRPQGFSNREADGVRDVPTPLDPNAAKEKESLQTINRETKPTIDRYRSLTLSEPQLFGRQLAVELIHLSDRLLHAGLSDLALEAIQEALETLKSLKPLSPARPDDKSAAVPTVRGPSDKAVHEPGFKTDLGGPPAVTSSGLKSAGTKAPLLQPYLTFLGETRDAMNFYQEVFGGEVHFSTFGDTSPAEDSALQEKVTHSTLVSENGLLIMAADTPDPQDYTPGNNITMSLSGEDEVLLRAYFERLAVGGTIIIPLERAPWGETFGMVADKFGVSWLVNINRLGASGEGSTTDD